MIAIFSIIIAIVLDLSLPHNLMTISFAINVTIYVTIVIAHIHITTTPPRVDRRRSRLCLFRQVQIFCRVG